MLDAVGLQGLRERLPQQLSGGQLQRVAIARALIHAPMQVLINFCDLYGDTNKTNTRLRCAFDAPQQKLVAHTLAEVKPLLAIVVALSQQGLWCVGYVRYEAAPAFDSALGVHPADEPLAWFGVYQQAWPEDTPQGDADTRVQWHSNLTRADFEAHMAQIRQSIAAGEFEQVLSVSSELFFDWQPGLAGQSGQIFTRPMKSTEPRGVYCDAIHGIKSWPLDRKGRAHGRPTARAGGGVCQKLAWWMEVR